MTQLKLLLVLVRPSLFSFALTLMLAAGIIGASNWAYLAANPWFFEFIYGDHGIVTTLERSPNDITGLQDGLATSPIVYAIGIGVLAVIAALVVFVGLRSVEHGVGALAHLRHETRAQRAEDFHRMLVRTLVGVFWVLFALFTFNFAMPFCILIWRIGVEGSDAQAISMSTISGLLLFLVLHLHVIFARLFVLRPRVFGGKIAVESSLLTSDH